MSDFDERMRIIRGIEDGDDEEWEVEEEEITRPLPGEMAEPKELEDLDAPAREVLVFIPSYVTDEELAAYGLVNYDDDEASAWDGRGGGYGLDKEIADKLKEKYDKRLENSARLWIETVTHEKFIGSFYKSLKDGVLLCKLLNAIKPGTVKRINDSKLPFKQMENISSFLKGCRELGLPTHDLFETVDLFEDKDRNVVIQCIHALARTIQVTVPEFPGPHLGPRQAEANPRIFDESKVKEGRNALGLLSRPTMGRPSVRLTGITMGSKYAGSSVYTGASKLMEGSRGYMESSSPAVMDPLMGAKYSGVGDSSTVSKATQGSAGVMERRGADVSGDIGFAAKASGVAMADYTLISAGSSATMDRDRKVTDTITAGSAFGAGDAGETAITAGSRGLMAREIYADPMTRGAKDGPGSAGYTKIAMGSSGMERSAVDVSRDIAYKANQNREWEEKMRKWRQESAAKRAAAGDAGAKDDPGSEEKEEDMGE